jgi:hypothetical protein
MKIYLATGAREYLMLLLMCGCKQVLVSYEYPEPYASKKLLLRNGVKLMVDSGAFSAWSKGRKIDIDEYIKFIIDNKEVVDPERIVNLDIILGGRENLAEGKKLEVGMKNRSSKEDFEEACRKGFENYYYMMEKLTPVFGEQLKVIHVFHQGDDFKWLEKMLKECTSIGISPNNDESTESKSNWLTECFKMIKEINPDIRTHAFGVTSFDLLEKFPYTTADSSSWAMTSAFGSILTPLGRFVVSDESKDKPGHVDKCTEQIKKSLEEYLLSNFGFTLDSVRKKYKYRNIVNIFHFMEMEDLINKTGHSFDQHVRQKEMFPVQRASKEEIIEMKEKILINNVL